MMMTAVLVVVGFGMLTLIVWNVCKGIELEPRERVPRRDSNQDRVVLHIEHYLRRTRRKAEQFVDQQSLPESERPERVAELR